MHQAPTHMFERLSTINHAQMNHWAYPDTKEERREKKAWLKGIYFTKKAPCKRDTCLKKAVVKFPPSIAISPSILFWFAFFKMFSSTVRSLINLRRNIKRFSLLKITFLFFTEPMIIGCIKPPPYTQMGWCWPGGVKRLTRFCRSFKFRDYWAPISILNFRFLFLLFFFCCFCFWNYAKKVGDAHQFKSNKMNTRMCQTDVDNICYVQCSGSVLSAFCFSLCLLSVSPLLCMLIYCMSVSVL